MPRYLLALVLTLPALQVACATDGESGPRVVMETTLGRLELVVYTEHAPVTATNFLRLVDGGHLDDATFYRTVSPANDNGSPAISVVQGGIGERTPPFEPIAHEPTSVSGLRHVDGAISMARGEVGTASTEFFICIGSQPALDFGGRRNADGQGFAVFGKVVSGMDVVRAIHRAPANAPTDIEYVRGQLLEAPVAIRSVRRVSPAGSRPKAASDTVQ